MNYKRILAILKKFFKVAIKDTHRLVDIIYWPTQDILLWGLTGYWIQHEQSSNLQLNLLLLTGLVLWTFMAQISYEIPWSFLDEFWSCNFANLFATPLKLSEWTISIMIIAILKGIFALIYCTTIVWFLYDLNLFYLGLLLIPILFSLVLFGWTIGFITSSFLMFWGQKMQFLAWIMSWVFSPFCGIFYPIETLPFLAQKISYMLPPSYIFNAIREFINTGIINYFTLFIGVFLSIFYLILSITAFYLSFKRSKINGLFRLEQYQ